MNRARERERKRERECVCVCVRTGRRKSTCGIREEIEIERDGV